MVFGPTLSTSARCCSSPEAASWGRSERRLAGPAEGGRFGAPDLSQRPAAARTWLSAVEVDLQELPMLVLDVRWDATPYLIRGVGQDPAHRLVEPVDLLGPKAATFA